MKKQISTVFVYIQYSNDSAYYKFVPKLVESKVFELSEVKRVLCKNENDFDKILTNQEVEESVDKANINSLLMACLIESKLDVEHFQCVKRRGSTLYFYVKASNSVKIDLLSQSNCFKCENNKATVKFKKYIKRINKKTRKNIRKSADEAASYSFKLDKMNFVYIGLSALLAVAGITVSVCVDGKDFFSALCALIVFPLAKLIYDVVCRYKNFKYNCDTVLLSEVSEEKKSVIIDNIKGYCKKNCKDIEFSDETYDIGSREIFIYSRKENSALAKVDNSTEFTIKKHKCYSSEQSKKALAAVVEQKRLQGKYLFNGHLLGVENDLNFEKGADIVLKNVDYYSYISCDELVFKRITAASAPEYKFYGCISCLDNETGMLKRYYKSPLTNLVGINLIVEIVVNNSKSAENESYYLINRQSTFNDVNGSKFVPSSSGSLEQSDVKLADKKRKRTGNKHSFKKTFACGMLRELNEESCIDKAEYGEKIRFLGYSKLMSKGGKPDFFALLRLEVTDKDEVLKTFNAQQNERIGGKKPLESDFMLLIEKKYFLSDDIMTDSFSPQLKYIRFLLQG